MLTPINLDLSTSTLTLATPLATTKTEILKKEKKRHLWKLLFILVPGILFGKISEFLDNKNIAVPVGLTIMGVALGFLFYYLTKEKTKIIKAISLAVLIIIPFSFIILKVENELEKEWINQTVDVVEFSSPNKLDLIYSKIPENLKGYYSKMEVYNDQKSDKSTTLYSIELKDLEINLQDYFEQYLNSFKSKIPNIETIEIVMQEKTENSLSSKFKFTTENEKLSGYCNLILKDKKLNMFWLIPFSESYSDKYIEKFKGNIVKL